MTNHFKNILIWAQPASGKSEVLAFHKMIKEIAAKQAFDKAGRVMGIPGSGGRGNGRN